MKIDVIIPVYKPGKSLVDLVEAMAQQDVSINKTIVMNTEQSYFDKFAYSTRFLDNQKNLVVRHVSKREYDCGKTRNAGVKLSDADYFIIMSQKAVPIGKEIISKLLLAFEKDPKVAVAYARNVACEDASESVKFATSYTFPELSAVHGEEDFENLGWLAYMNSNTCAMYKRSVFDELGGFTNHIVTNEDIVYAANAIKAGYKVSYVADATVIYDAVYSIDEYTRRSFDFAVTVAKYPEIFDAVSIKDAGKNFDRLVTDHIKKNGTGKDLHEYKRIRAAKKKGFAKGLKFEKIGYDKIGKFSNNPEYWRVDEILRDRTCVDGRAGYGRSKEELEMISQPPVKAHKREE